MNIGGTKNMKIKTTSISVTVCCMINISYSGFDDMKLVKNRNGFCFTTIFQTCTTCHRGIDIGAVTLSG